jgi:hypothetical protein
MRLIGFNFWDIFQVFTKIEEFFISGRVIELLTVKLWPGPAWFEIQ